MTIEQLTEILQIIEYARYDLNPTLNVPYEPIHETIRKVVNEDLDDIQKIVQTEINSMTKITKATLIERGFLTPFEDGSYCLPFDDKNMASIMVDNPDEGIQVQVSGEVVHRWGEKAVLEVPNCKTMEDLDLLIRLFKR